MTLPNIVLQTPPLSGKSNSPGAANMERLTEGNLVWKANLMLCRHKRLILKIVVLLEGIRDQYWLPILTHTTLTLSRTYYANN